MATEGWKTGSGSPEPAENLFAPSDEVLEQAARIASHFALLEYGVRELVHRLLDVPENIARAVTASLSFYEIQNLASSLARERVPARGSELKKILKLIHRVEEMKDGVSRFLWGLEVANGKRVPRKRQGMAPDGKDDLDPADLNAIVVEIAMTMHEVERFRHEIQKQMQRKSE